MSVYLLTCGIWRGTKSIPVFRVPGWSGLVTYLLDVTRLIQKQFEYLRSFE